MYPTNCFGGFIASSVCAVISCLCTTEYSADRFPTCTIKLPMYYGAALIVLNNRYLPLKVTMIWVLAMN